MKPKRWSFLNWVHFSLAYFLAKLLLLWEVRTPKWTFFFFEIHYSFTNLINTVWRGALPPVLYHGQGTLETRHGTFRIRSGSHDAAIVSPAFERGDMNHLFGVLDDEFNSGRKVGFFDVGANIGQFAVRVSRYCAGRPLKIWAFEPMPENLRLLHENLALNSQNSSEVQVLPYALSDKDGVTTMRFSPQHPGDSAIGGETGGPGTLHQVEMRRADGLLNDMAPVLIVKIDVEGHECNVLQGMRKTIEATDKCWLCIEDIFGREALYDFLVNFGFEYQTKLTPYNSWWLWQPRPVRLTT